MIGGNVEVNKKCQYNDRDSTHERLFRESSVKTLNECHTLCVENENCKYFSYSDINGDSSHPGVCMGCTDIENMDDHTGFSVYERDTFQSGFVDQVEQALVTGSTNLGSKHIFTFPWAEHVQVTVFDFGHFMNLFIEMPRLQLGKTSGHCGNFNGVEDEGDEPVNEMVADEDLLFKAHLWNFVIPNDECPENSTERRNAVNYCAQAVVEEVVPGDMEDCVIDCCSDQTQCSLTDLSLAGEREWKAATQKAHTEAKAAAQAKQDATQARNQPADGTCGDCHPKCKVITPGNKHCNNPGAGWYKLCPRACGRSPQLVDGIRSCQGGAAEDKCPPLPQ